MTIPTGYYGRISPRSSLTINHLSDVSSIIIDSDFSGVIQVILFNHSFKRYLVQIGDKIARLILHKIDTPAFVEFSSN